MIKELKAFSPLAVFRLYTEAIYFFTTITPVLKVYIWAHTFSEITIISGSETSEQYLQTRQDIIQAVSKVISLLNIILLTCCLSSRYITLFFDSEQSHFIWENYQKICQVFSNKLVIWFKDYTVLVYKLTQD